MSEISASTIEKRAEEVRETLWYAMDVIEEERLFVPPERDLKINKKNYASTLVLPFSNLVLNHGAVILYGGKASGKTSLARLIGEVACGSWYPTSYSYLLGDSEVRRSQVSGTIDPAALQEGKRKPLWSEFVDHPIKIIDEINRMSSSAFTYFMSLMGNNMVSLYDEKKELLDYRVFATMNPSDEGTNKIPAPMMDRFALMIPFRTLASNELESVLGRPDSDLGGKEQVKKATERLKNRGSLEKKDFENLSLYARQTVEVPEKIDRMISLTVADFGSCDRAEDNDKDRLPSDLKPPEICKKNSDCRFFNQDPYVCYTTSQSLSTRTAMVLKEYSVAVAYLVGAQRVSADIVKSIATFALAHRITPCGEAYEKPPYFGAQPYTFVKDMIARSLKTTRDKARKKALAERDTAVASKDPVIIKEAINSISSHLDDPLKYDILKTLRNEQSRTSV